MLDVFVEQNCARIWLKILEENESGAAVFQVLSQQLPQLPSK